MSEKKTLVIDINIPYCIAPEKYTNRIQVTGSNEEKNAYMNALLREAVSYENELEDYEIKAIRLGGGAATVMKPDLLGELLYKIRQKLPISPGAEVSFDALPNTIGTPSLTGLANGKPNRTELMLRSMNGEELAALGCSFDIQDIRNAILFLGKFHLNNISFTLNFGIPGQTMKSWMFTLSSCAIMNPAHITIQPLDVKDAEGMPTEKEQLEMFTSAIDFLSEKGYLYYGSGLFSLPYHENRFEVLSHNGCARLGLGVNAVSMIDGFLTRNTNNTKIYIHNSGDFEKTTAQAFEADPEYLIRNYISGRLGMKQGFVFSDYEKRFSTPIPEPIMRKIEALENQELLIRTEEGFSLTAYGEFKTNFGRSCL